MEKASYQPKNSKKDVRDLMAQVGSRKHWITNPPILTEPSFYVAQPLKRRLQKKAKTGLKIQKKI